jgi:hypothetical protein
MKPFDLDEFETLLDVHGPNWERWPDAERVQAQAFMAGSEPARSAFRQAERLEAALSLVPGLEPAPDLGNRIVRLARVQSRARFRWWPFDSPLPLLGWAGAAALGLWVGSVSELDAEAAAVDVVEINDEWSELSAIGLAAEWAEEDEP